MSTFLCTESIVNLPQFKNTFACKKIVFNHLNIAAQIHIKPPYVTRDPS
jgi:hypothetical protein